MFFEAPLIITVLFTQDIVDQHGNGPFHLSQFASQVTQEILFTPNDPGVNDDLLRRYYSAQLGEGEDAKTLVDYLLTLSVVEAAWVQAAEGPPL